MVQTRRNKLIKLIIFAAALCLGMSAPANAAKKKDKAHEVYSATEEELPSSDDGTAVLPPPTGLRSSATKIEKKSEKSEGAVVAKDEALSERVQALEKEIESLKTSSKNNASTTSAEPTKNAFDNVPEDQRAGVAKRLELVADLIKRHGRAYDYRQHTLKDLRSIVAELDDRSFDSRAGQPINKNSVSPDFAAGGQNRRMASHMSPNSF